MTSMAFIIGVIPLALASGAGAEMRRSLGTAVFSGMLGVTLFGIFLTPVFYAVIQGLSESRLFMAELTRWAGSALLGGLVGLGIGFSLAQLDVVGLSWALGACGPAGVLLTLAALGIHRRIRVQSSISGRAGRVRRKTVVPSGDPQP
jgi:multidrug efflux pump